MIRVLVTGDSHFDTRNRWDECLRVHAWIADLVATERPDLVVHTGDLYERRSDPTERAAVAEWLQHLAAVCPVLLVRGNHDALGDLPIFARLKTTHPVLVEEGVGVHRIATAAGELVVGALAWPERRAMERVWAQFHGRAPTREEAPQAAHDGTLLALRGLGMESRIDLVAAHAMVSGSVTTVGQPAVGCDVELGLDAFRGLGCPVVLGHVHAPQAWVQPTGIAYGLDEVFDLSRGIWYAGSPRRTAFGETETKSVLMLEFEPRSRVLASVQRIPTPCRAMWLVEGGPWSEADAGSTDTSGAFNLAIREPEGFRAHNAEIRLRYTTPSDRRTAMRAEAESWRNAWIQQGAALVQLEERVLPSGSARAPEVAAARTVTEKLRALWSARAERHGERVDEARAERLLRLAREIETESAA